MRIRYTKQMPIVFPDPNETPPSPPRASWQQQLQCLSRRSFEGTAGRLNALVQAFRLGFKASQEERGQSAPEGVYAASVIEALQSAQAYIQRQRSWGLVRGQDTSTEERILEQTTVALSVARAQQSPPDKKER